MTNTDHIAQTMPKRREHKWQRRHEKLAKKGSIITALIVGVLAMASASSAAAAPTASDNVATRWSFARQLVLVTVPSWTSSSGVLRTFSRSGSGAWEQTGGPHPVEIGSTGAAWGRGLQPSGYNGPTKREGDKKSTAGVFRIGTAFGYPSSVATKLHYLGLTATDWCVDVSKSPHYNRIVNARVVGFDGIKGATEPMRRDIYFHGDQEYRLGFVIEQNWQQKPEGGSCIFGHLWESPSTPTVGCVSMAPSTMKLLFGWLATDRNPILILLPRNEYALLKSQWGLPSIGYVSSRKKHTTLRERTHE